MTLLSRTGVWFLALLVIFSACKKDENFEVDNESQSVVDYTLAHQEFTNVPALIYKMLMRTRGATTSLYPINNSGMVWESGDTVKYSTTPVFTCNAAQLQSAMPDGNTRSGSIKVSVLYPINLPGSVVTATLSNYVANGISYQAAVLSMTTVGEAGNYIGVQCEVKGGQCDRGEAHFSYQGNHRIAVYYAGGPQFSGAYHAVYGTASGQSRTGLKYTAETEKDQLKSHTCSCMSAGTTNLVPEGFKSKLLNFGDGQCDELGNFTIAENTISFKLK